MPNSFNALTLETFIPNSFNLTYDCFVGPCIGFKHLGVIHNYNFTQNSTIILYSNNPVELNWSKFIYENWTGNLYTFWSMLQDFIKNTNSVLEFPPLLENKQINSVYLDQIYSEYGLDMDMLIQQWHIMKKFKWIFSQNKHEVSKLINQNCKQLLYLYDNQNWSDELIKDVTLPFLLEKNNNVIFKQPDVLPNV